MVDGPDVVTGWNIEFYAIPYICKRLDRVLGEKLMKRFSPWGLVSEGEVYINGRKNTTFDVGGITQLDYLALYKKFTYKAQESYRLDYIAEVELVKRNSTTVSMIPLKISILMDGRNISSITSLT